MAKKERDSLLTEETFRELAGVHDAHCISIYIPTARAGMEVDKKHGQTRLKNNLKDVRSRLEEEGLNQNEIDETLSGPDALLEDVQFWRNLSDGLALFVHGSVMQHFALPLSFDEYNRVADHFYLLPLIPMFNDNGKFYLLLLSRQRVNLFECTRHFIAEVYIEDLAPEKLEDVVGYDYEEKSLQHRTHHGGDAGAMFHGQGAGKDDKKIETEKFFRAVDAGLMKLLHDQDAPLVLACVERHYSLYREITQYQFLFDDHISGNPDEADPLLLHEEAWPLVEDHFRQHRETKKEQVQDLSATGRTAWEIGEIVPAAIEGRVDTLFIQEGKDQEGVYDRTRRMVITDEEQEARVYRASLYNMAAVSTLENGGDVFLAAPGDMPLKDTEILALMRY
ncbi:MAG: hypothetical protein R6U78_01605 [Bacteroidales bacterium]